MAADGTYKVDRWAGRTTAVGKHLKISEL